MEELKKFVKSLEKYKISKKNKDNFEKNHIKTIILEKRKKKEPIEPLELGVYLGYPKKLVEEVNKEINEEKKIKKVLKKQKKKMRKPRIKLKKILDEDDKKTLKDFFLKIILFGIPINFSLWCFIFHPFNWFSWLAYGYTLWLIKKEIVSIIRGLWIK